MERAEIFDLVRGHMAAILEVDESEIDETSKLVEDLDADSLDMLELILVIKDDFKITINDGEVKLLLKELARFLPDDWSGKDLTDDELAQITRALTVGTLLDFVESKTGTGD
jgi:acyl carrier protein